VGSLQYGPDIVKPNLHEFLTTYLPDFVGPAHDERSLKEKVSEKASGICAEYGSRVVLTRGAHSVWLYEGPSFAELAVEAAQPVNTTGSGDAFTAGLAAALAEGCHAPRCRLGKYSAVRKAQRPSAQADNDRLRSTAFSA
jgi:sugar/nucleoside kinase (ribokinase family)